MILSQLIHYTDTNSVEATWVDGEGVPIRCQSYADVQMDDLVADLGADAAAHAGLIAQVRAAIVPATPRPPYVPPVVSATQAQIALANAGLFDQIDAFMDALPKADPRRIAWTKAAEFTRDSPTLEAIAQQFGLSSAQIDALFIAADAIVV